MCKYFDDLVLSDGYSFSLQQGLVSEAEVAVVISLHELLRKHEAPGGDDWDNAAVLNDPEWHAIAQEARRATNQLLTLPLAPEERQLLGYSP